MSVTARPKSKFMMMMETKRMKADTRMWAVNGKYCDFVNCNAGKGRSEGSFFKREQFRIFENYENASKAKIQVPHKIIRIKLEKRSNKNSLNDLLEQKEFEQNGAVLTSSTVPAPLATMTPSLPTSPAKVRVMFWSLG
jgi:hypothetical protein